MTKINASKGEFVNLINGLFKVQTLEGKTLGLSVSRNIAVIQEALKELELMGTPSPEFMELATKVNELSQLKDPSPEVKEQLDILEKENKVLIDTRKAQLETVQNSMSETIELELIMISEDDLPESITAQQITGILKIIK